MPGGPAISRTASRDTFRKIHADLPLTHEISEQAVVPLGVANTAGHDRETSRELSRELRRLRFGPDPRQFGCCPRWEQDIACPRVGFRLGVVLLTAGYQIVDKPADIVLAQVQRDMRQFVRETEPEIVEPIVA